MFFMLFPIVALGNMLEDTLETHWMLREHHKNILGTWWEHFENIKTSRNSKIAQKSSLEPFIKISWYWPWLKPGIEGSYIYKVGPTRLKIVGQEN